MESNGKHVETETGPIYWGEPFMPYKTIDGITSSVIPFCVKDGIVFVLLGQRGKRSRAVFIDNTPMFVSRRAPGDAKHSSCRLRFHPH